MNSIRAKYVDGKRLGIWIWTCVFSYSNGKVEQKFRISVEKISMVQIDKTWGLKIFKTMGSDKEAKILLQLEKRGNRGLSFEVL